MEGTIRKKLIEVSIPLEAINRETGVTFVVIEQCCSRS